MTGANTEQIHFTLKVSSTDCQSPQLSTPMQQGNCIQGKYYMESLTSGLCEGGLALKNPSAHQSRAKVLPGPTQEAADECCSVQEASECRKSAFGHVSVFLHAGQFAQFHCLSLVCPCRLFQTYTKKLQQSLRCAWSLRRPNTADNRHPPPLQVRPWAVWHAFVGSWRSGPCLPAAVC